MQAKLTAQTIRSLRPEKKPYEVVDLIQGGMAGPEELDRQWDSFDERASRARAPVFYVGGNHDLSGEVLGGVWDERYGQRYYHFVYKDVLFLALNTEDILPERMQEITLLRDEAFRVLGSQGMGMGMGAIGLAELFTWPESSAGNITAAQSEYFQKAIADNPDVRWTFLFMHKAAWERDGEENFAVPASIGSPVISISSARLRPTARTIATPGVWQNQPPCPPGIWNFADSPATARSHDATS